MGDKYRKSLLDGTARDIPEVSSKIIRVFISSTFSDMIWERNALMEDVYPKLKDYCRDRYGLEFQAVDMRWGVHARAQNDHQASSLCLQEIHNCQQLSQGPNFVILMGQKYGSRPFPTYIEQWEFELLESALEPGDPALELLHTWFRLDENSLPPTFILQPIPTILPNYNNQDKVLRAADEKKWAEIYSGLTMALRKAASLCHEQGKIDRDNYFMSVTENEILTGVLQSKPSEAAKKCLCFVREIKDLRDHLDHPKAPKFIDLKAERELDKEAGEMLNVLKTEKLPAVLPADNISHYQVSWCDQGGINPQAHADYLKSFCEDFYQKMVGLIDQSMASLSGLHQDLLLSEVIQHLKMAEAWARVFHGRQDVLSAVRQYLAGPSKQPLVIYGPSGSGKSAVMAKCCHLAPTFSTTSNPSVIIRFLGITPMSSGVRPVLESICQQLCVLYNKNPNTVPSDFAQLLPFFRELLQIASAGRPIVIFLDAVDQLSPENFAFKLSWLPKTLPANVKIVLSCLPELHGILETFKSFLKPESLFELEPLGDELSQETLIDRLQLANRTLNKDQLDVVHELFKSCSLPLYTKVLFEEICGWKSYTKVSCASLSSSIEGAIQHMLDNLEVEHGRVLVSHTLAYLTASRNGLTIVELEDLLSLDDDVLSSVFTYWLPPIRRIPPAILTRLKLQLHGYVVDREADGVAVIYWYHRKFIEVARERYLKDKTFASQIHNVLSEYFLGTWGGGKPKPFSYTEFLAQRLNIKEKIGTADRKVPLQPLQFRQTGPGNQVSYNLRKLRELPQQLVASRRLKELKTIVAFNYDWYMTKIKALSLQELLTDLELAQQFMQEDKSLKQVKSVLRMGASSLNSNPDCLSLELSGRLLDFYYSDPNIQGLIDGCDEATDCMLTAPFQCFDGPTKSLVLSLEGHNKAILDAVFLSGNELVSFGLDGMLCFWDLTRGELLRQIDASFVEPNYRAFLLVSRDGKYLVALNKVESSFLGIYLANTGDLVHKYKHAHSQHLHKILIAQNYICVDFGIVELKTGKVVNKLNKYNVKITEYVFLDFTAEEKHVLIGGPKETAMFEISSCKKVFSIPSEHMASHIKFTPDGKLGLIGYVLSCVVKMIDTDQNSPTYGEEIRVVDAPNLYPELGIADDKRDLFVQEVSDINLSPNGVYALALLKRFYITVWNLSAPEVEPKMLTMPEGMNAAGKFHRYHYSPSFTHDNKHVVAYKMDGIVDVWNVESGDYVTEVAAHNNEIMHMNMDKFSDLMVTIAKDDLTIKIWDCKDMVINPKQEEAGSNQSCVKHLVIPAKHNVAISLHTVSRFSRKSYQMIYHFGLDLWDLNNHQKTSLLPFGQFGQVLQLHSSDNGEILLLLLGNITQRRIRLLDLKEGKLLFSVTQPHCVLTRLSGDGKFLASVTKEDGKCLTMIRACESGSLLHIFEDYSLIEFLSDSLTAVLLSTTGKLLTYDLTTSAEASLAVGNADRLFKILGDAASKVLVVSKPNKRKHCQGEVINTMPLEKLGHFDGISEKGIEDLSGDGKFCIDSALQLFDLTSFTKVKQLQPGTLAAKDQVKLLSNGEYVVWVDAKVTDLLKVCRVADDQVVACCNLHALPCCLAVSRVTNDIVVGTNLGQVMVFSLKIPAKSINHRTKNDRVNQNSSAKLNLTELPLQLQQELMELAKQARIFTFNVTTLDSESPAPETKTWSSSCNIT